MNLAKVSEACASTCVYIRIIIATTEHWFQVTTYSLSTGRSRVKLTLVDCDIPPLS